MSVEVRDVAAGLWLWRQPHPDWQEGGGWEPEVSSFAVETGGELVLLDLPFERVLVSHGEPVHTRADFEAALRRDPWLE